MHTKPEMFGLLTFVHDSDGYFNVWPAYTDP